MFVPHFLEMCILATIGQRKEIERYITEKHDLSGMMECENIVIQQHALKNGLDTVSLPSVLI